MFLLVLTAFHAYSYTVKKEKLLVSEIPYEIKISVRNKCRKMSKKMNIENFGRQAD